MFASKRWTKTISILTYKFLKTSTLCFFIYKLRSAQKFIQILIIFLNISLNRKGIIFKCRRRFSSKIPKKLKLAKKCFLVDCEIALSWAKNFVNQVGFRNKSRGYKSEDVLLLGTHLQNFRCRQSSQLIFNLNK